MDTPQRPISPLHWPRMAAVLRSPWQATRNRGSMRPQAALLSLAVLVPAVLWWALSAERALRVVPVVTALLAVGASMIVWTLLAFNVLRQNHPHWVAVVPGHATALRQALVVAALCISVLCGLIGAWPGWSFTATALSVAAGCAVVACAIRWPWLWLALAVAMPSALWAFKVALPAPVAWAWRDAPLAFAGTVVACVLLALRAVVFTGSAGHARAQTRLAAMGMRGRADGCERPFGGLGWLGASQANRVYAAWMRHLLARGGSSIGARLALGAGPQVHWTGVLSNVVLSLAIFMAFFALDQWMPQWQADRGIRGGLLMALVVVSLMLPIQLPVAMWASRREQVLLTLLPGVPRDAGLNRWLAGRLAALHLGVMLWQLLTVLLIRHAVAGDTDFSTMAEMALSALALSPLLTVLLWRDWARAKAPSGAMQVNMIAVTLGIGSVAAGWVLWLERPWHQLAMLAALALLPLALWRWRQIRDLPMFWPVGRL
jgi:hypothetical protein